MEIRTNKDMGEMPYLKIEDMTKEDWQALDVTLEKYDRSDAAYNLEECRVLKFVLLQIHNDKSNFIKVHSFIRNIRCIIIFKDFKQSK